MSRAVTLVVALVGLSHCTDQGSPPKFVDVVGPQTVYVAARYDLTLRASDPDGDPMAFAFASSGVDISRTAAIAPLSDGGAFSWTPVANQVGQLSIDFIVSDGTGSDRMTVPFEVKSSTSPNTAPTFVEPAGFGAALDLATKECIDVGVRVIDPDTARVQIRQDPPIAGSTLQTTGALSAQFHWCPDAEQARQQEHILSLWADDSDNAPVFKKFTIIVHPEVTANCPGAPPTVSHTPLATLVSSGEITLEATIDDDRGLKGNPTLYVSDQAPMAGVAADITSMRLVPMRPKPQTADVYQATVENPLPATATPGTRRTLYYVFVASDDDDPEGDCDHRVLAPASGAYQLEVEQPDTSCSSNGDCPLGMVCESSCRDDHCIPLDDDGDGFFREQNGCPQNQVCPPVGIVGETSHCAESCTSKGDCRAGQDCKIFDTERACAVAGKKDVGAACASFTECSGELMCLPWKGGYCSLSDCDTRGVYGGACPSGSVCYEHLDSRFTIVLTHWICLQRCQSDQDCRQVEGYACRDINDDLGAAARACLP